MTAHLQSGSSTQSTLRSELRRDTPRLLGGAILVYLFLAGTGLLVNRVLSHGAFGRWDRGVSRWFYEHRTDTLNTLTHVGVVPLIVATSRVYRCQEALSERPTAAWRRSARHSTRGK